jgi:hypothetical protein
MKITEKFALCLSIMVAAVFAVATFNTNVLAQSTREDVATVRVVEGNPNTLAKFGVPGDVAIDKNTGNAYVKTGATGNTSWVPNLPLSTATNNPTTGSMVLTGTSVKIYLTGSTGVEVKSGTTAPF